MTCSRTKEHSTAESSRPPRPATPLPPEAKPLVSRLCPGRPVREAQSCPAQSPLSTGVPRQGDIPGNGREREDLLCPFVESTSTNISCFEFIIRHFLQTQRYKGFILEALSCFTAKVLLMYVCVCVSHYVCIHTRTHIAHYLPMANARNCTILS